MKEARTDPSADASHPSASNHPVSASSAPRSRSGVNDPMVGTVINEKYRVVSVLATGGMGRIYTAEQLPLGRMVALKVILPTLADSFDDPVSGRESIRLRFLREASVLAKLQHANIVTVFDYGRIETPPSDRERFFMAMELLEGETLQHRLEHGVLPQAEALELLRQMARGLRAAHARGIVHRDLKPSNLMLVHGPEADCILKLLDFGVTKVMGEKNQDLTDEGIVVGSPRFMSPEQMGGNVDGRTDIYSFGIIAYTMLTGSPPFKGDTSMLTMMAHLNNPLPSLVTTRPELGVSEWVNAVIQRCCAKDPADRYQTAQELIDALRPPGDGVSGALSLRNSSGEIPVANVRIDLSRAGEGPSDEDVTEPRPESSSPSGRLLVLGLFLAAVAAVVLLWNRKPRPVAELAPVAQAQVSRISVTSTPTDVEVYGDGKLLGRTPFTTSVPAGSPKTHLELKRAGYEVFAKDIDPSHDVDVVAVLAADAPSASAPPPASAAMPAPTTASQPRRASTSSRGAAGSHAVAEPPPPPPSASAPPPAPAATASAPPPPAKKVDPFEDRQ